MVDTKNKGGRPWLTVEQKEQRKELLLLKIEPYLCTGLSVNKALIAAQIHNSEFYKYMKEDELFGEKIAHFKVYISVLVCKIISTELMNIAERQREQGELSKEDRDFVMKFAIHADIMSDMYGRREKIMSVEPEEEIQKLKFILEDMQYSYNP